MTEQIHSCEWNKIQINNWFSNPIYRQENIKYISTENGIDNDFSLFIFFFRFVVSVCNSIVGKQEWKIVILMIVAVVATVNVCIVELLFLL